MAEVLDFMGKFPFPPGKKKPVVITRKMMKMFVYPLDDVQSSDLNWVLASTDKFTCGIYQLPPGGTFDPPDVHDGDEVYRVLKGTLTMLNPETGQVVKVRQGEALLIPKGTWHKAYNFENEEFRILFMIAPKIWDESKGSPDSFPGTMKLYKSEQ